eukprot:NODE_4986_length_734_cov_51.740146_g4628_i0.p1 GENE.NODE_4986_length_734_cov_51.740146_g4628_i0~~NODE_4986_length_734_cov_51.740146_g4628_i0.p1  ORF type:complete len:141 (+),score=26.06 NODE_4986_length_734_cov_51.740146_g4628_i0:150-572(+)
MRQATVKVALLPLQLQCRNFWSRSDKKQPQDAMQRARALVQDAQGTVKSAAQSAQGAVRQSLAPPKKRSWWGGSRSESWTDRFKSNSWNLAAQARKRTRRTVVVVITLALLAVFLHGLGSQIPHALAEYQREQKQKKNSK